MKNVLSITGICFLAACGGSGSGANTASISSGILQNIEIPSDADLSDAPAEVRALVSEFRDLNDNNAPTETLPGGRAEYAGTYGIGLDENETVLYGDMNLDVNFGTQNATGTVSNITGDNDGTALDISNDLDVTLAIDTSDSTVSGNISGTVSLDDEDYDVSGTLGGGFGGTDAEVLLGETEGTITNPDSSTDGFSGFWATEEQ